ncbi:hypothetical protein E2C01_052021 [Portunus trituberculatus]|uniref:Uncharacterized protein n=1 Tax=Portunus trituberculatus TaxID=210409 RepID=A0A5B7GKC3_PORTR|nr:hypothetical protein [Portunus trituberculatus]
MPLLPPPTFSHPTVSLPYHRQSLLSLVSPSLHPHLPPSPFPASQNPIRVPTVASPCHLVWLGRKPAAKQYTRKGEAGGGMEETGGDWGRIRYLCGMLE